MTLPQAQGKTRKRRRKNVYFSCIALALALVFTRVNRDKANGDGHVTFVTDNGHVTFVTDNSPSALIRWKGRKKCVRIALSLRLPVKI